MVNVCFPLTPCLLDDVLIFVKITDEEVAKAPLLEPALESLIRRVDLHEDVILAFRVHQSKDRGLCRAMDATAKELKETRKDALEMDPTKGFAHMRKRTKVHKAWDQAKATVEVEQRVDAVARAHGYTVQAGLRDFSS